MKKYKSTTTSNPNYRIMTVEQPSSVVAESYRRIKVALEFSEVDTELKVIQVCSSVQGEGKSVTVLNLAATYAEDGKKVLVVDLDLRRPKLHRAFKVENKNGITDVLAGNTALKDAIKEANGIYCLPRGSKVPYPTVILNSENIQKLFIELKNEYDVIVVDCPPVLAVSDAIIISKLCDCCLFVVSQLRTEKAAAKEAVTVLKQNGVKLAGCVYTGISKSSGNQYNSKYKYYYQSEYGRSDASK